MDYTLNYINKLMILTKTHTTGVKKKLLVAYFFLQYNPNYKNWFTYSCATPSISTQSKYTSYNPNH